MKPGTVVLLAGGALLGYYLLNLGVAGNTLQLVFTGVTMPNFPDLRFGFMVQNVSNQVLTFGSMAGTVSVNDTIIGNISDFTPTTIPPNSQIPLTVAFQPSLIGLVGEVASLIQTPNANITFKAAGNMNVNNLVLPFSVDTTVKL